MDILWGLILLALLGAVYFLPTIVAARRRTVRQNGQFIINLFLGWTLIGWVIALAWAACDDCLPRET